MYNMMMMMIMIPVMMIIIIVKCIAVVDYRITGVNSWLTWI